MPTEAERKAIRKYDQKFFMVRFRMTLAKYDQIKGIAEANGESIAAMFNRLADAEIDKHNKKAGK